MIGPEAGVLTFEGGPGGSAGWSLLALALRCCFSFLTLPENVLRAYLNVSVIKM